MNTTVQRRNLDEMATARREITVPKRCSVCEHDLREEIDRDIHLGDLTRAIGERFGLSGPTVKAHRRSGHHIVGSTPRPWTSPNTASDLLTKIEERRGDHDALRSLRLAAATLPKAERIVLISELRRRAGRVRKVGALRSAA